MPFSRYARRVCSTALISSSSQSAALCEPKPGAPPTNPKVAEPLGPQTKAQPAPIYGKHKVYE